MEVLNLNMMKHFLKSILLYERKKMNRAVFENIEDELKEAEKMEYSKDDEDIKGQKYTLGGGTLSLICCGYSKYV